MGFAVVAGLVEELTERAKNTDSEDEEILREKLRGLGPRERILLEKAFYDHQWDVGSASVVRLLCQVDLFSLPIYLLKQPSSEEQQNIFNDLIETEHYLLSDLIKSSIPDATISHKLRNIISDGISHLLDDLLNCPNVTVPNYLHALRSYLTAPEMNYILNLHLVTLLEKEECSPRDAIKLQFSWNVEPRLHKNPSLLEISKAICLSNCEAVLVRLLELTAAPTFTGWKYGLGLFNLILSSQPELRPLVKKHLSELFTDWIAKRNELNFTVMMLLARELAYSTGSAQSDTYQQWYKFQIAEINYTLKSKEDFQYAMRTLTALVPLESDPELLKVHINVAIPAPPYCKIFVTEFKERSKRRELDCCPVKRELALPDEMVIDDDDVIVID